MPFGRFLYACMHASHACTAVESQDASAPHVKHAIAIGVIRLNMSSISALNCTYANGTGTSFILTAL
eukprot:2822001-Pleurochrysis_carterae.AAC.1